LRGPNNVSDSNHPNVVGLSHHSGGGDAGPSYVGTYNDDDDDARSNSTNDVSNFVNVSNYNGVDDDGVDDSNDVDDDDLLQIDEERQQNDF